MRLTLKALADEFCQPNFDGGETCEGDISKDPEVFLGIAIAMSISSHAQIKLSNGLLMPLIGYGTWKVVGDEEIFKVLDAALAANYKHIDTAVAYNNHRSNQSFN